MQKLQHARSWLCLEYLMRHDPAKTVRDLGQTAWALLGSTPIYRWSHLMKQWANLKQKPTKISWWRGLCLLTIDGWLSDGWAEAQPEVSSSVSLGVSPLRLSQSPVLSFPWNLESCFFTHSAWRLTLKRRVVDNQSLFWCSMPMRIWLLNI